MGTSIGCTVQSFAFAVHTKSHSSPLLNKQSTQFTPSGLICNNISIAQHDCHLFVIGKLYENVEKGNQKAIEYMLEHRFKPWWYLEEKGAGEEIGDGLKEIADALNKLDSNPDKVLE